MNEKKWEKFFELIDQIVTDVSTVGSFTEMAAEVKSQAEKNGSDGNFRELISWFAE